MLQKSVVMAILGALEDAISRMAPWLCRIENWAEHRSLRGRLYVGGRAKTKMEIPIKTSPLIHIGYHKTGTTWLQQHLFDRREAGYCTPIQRSHILGVLVKPNQLDFDAMTCRSRLAPSLARESEKGLIPVVTCERLSGNPHSGGYDTWQIAHRLVDVFPEARVLIVIREQTSIILSCYKQYVKAGGTMPIETYLHPPHDFKVPRFDFQHFAYDRAIRLYQSLFGPERVLVLAYEQFQSNGAEFVKRIACFAGATAPDASGAISLLAKVENRGMTSVRLMLRRSLNHLAAKPTTLNPQPYFASRRAAGTVASGATILASVVPQFLNMRMELALRRYVALAAKDQYGASNRAVIALTGLPLENLGYALG